VGVKDLLLDGLALMVTDGPTAAAPVLRQATSAFASADIPVQESLQWGWLVRVAGRALWDDEGRRLTVRQVQLARDVGALDQLPQGWESRRGVARCRVRERPRMSVTARRSTG
jgi:hypothetical protein